MEVCHGSTGHCTGKTQYCRMVIQDGHVRLFIFVLNWSPTRGLISGKLLGGRSELHQPGKSEPQPHHTHFLCSLNLFNQNGISDFPQTSELSLGSQCYVQHTAFSHIQNPVGKLGRSYLLCAKGHLQVCTALALSEAVSESNLQFSLPWERIRPSNRN